MSSNDFKPKLSFKFYCEICNYGTDKKCNINNHFFSTKHQKSMISNQIKPFLSSHHNCDFCGKEYKDNSGLWRHKKKCNTKIDKVEDLKEFMKYIMKENTDMKNMIIDVVKNGTHNTINNISNSNNKTFNLSVFLNETCKDAMNITDFVDSIKLQLSDLINVGEMGYIEGISSIIIKNLNALDITLRPVHCTDKKRETMYIKDQDKWEREDVSKSALHKMIRKVANKNISLIQDYKERYPDCIKSSSRFSNQYNKIVIESMGCSGETSDFEKEEKIIKRVAKEVILDKCL
jgi:hypothetical protein